MEHLVNIFEKLILSRINVKRLLRYALYMFLSLLAQTMLLNRFRILGVCPMVLPAVAVAVGMFEGSSWGAFFGLIMGIFADMAFIENTVLFTLLFPALAFVSGFISQFFINRRFFAFMGAALAALLVTGAVQLLHTAVTDVFSLSMISTALLQTLWSLPFSTLAYFPPARWID